MVACRSHQATIAATGYKNTRSVSAGDAPVQGEIMFGAPGLQSAHTAIKRAICAKKQ